MKSQRIHVGGEWYVAASAARADETPHVLKHDESFMLTDRYGDIDGTGLGEQGLYHEDMRYLSEMRLAIEGVRPMFLGSGVKDDNSVLITEFMNPDLERHAVPQGTLHIFRAKLLWQGCCHEHIRIVNHGDETARLRLSLAFDADFADLFEVRGTPRQRRGRLLPVQVRDDEVLYGYDGLDGVGRRTRLRFQPRPDALAEREAAFDLQVAPREACHLYCSVDCERADSPPPPQPRPHYDQAYRENESARRFQRAECCVATTSNPQVNLWLRRSDSDVAMLSTDLPTGRYPYAGVPWYSTTFGRDGILTARELLWIDPAPARGVLAFLAQTQARQADPGRDAEPGKILHEARKCEMAATHEVPFERYYGSVDSTPLFVGLAGAYWQRTGELEFIRVIWPHVRAALDWIDASADADGFVRYARRSSDGLVQQGWKDSHDSVFHADGRMAEPPIALCEVQGYVYEARLLAAELAQALGETGLAQRLAAQAQALKRAFQERFWSEALGLYAIAIDASGQRCEVATSNAGHALWSGIAAPEHAARMAERLLQPDFYSGWGIRTVAHGQARYNPMSYHNGSIWPHDNALIAAGLARYGHTLAAMRIFSGLFDTTVHFAQHRLPELFCGFPRRASEGPTLYPVACSPQAWAAAGVYALLQACLGLEVDAQQRAITMQSPRLPEFIETMDIRQLGVGEHCVDLRLHRYGQHVGIDVLRKQGDVAVRVRM
ncbi:glycogen debranching N-terminal domain-containing protein [Ramlibacter sp.]|uniref:amylo-alpha-1,6-glucosidase n=1 Tax=Ramlibacter sp. TaxID=1917967 RepID=UPI002D4074B9|nr:glycogen debranching N-terminal domain-containing protein [Ramlibacter sp.]HYD75056.1 glycogen debranching N-terminal domain-containing protein [Ramlibacter sp.]